MRSFQPLSPRLASGVALNLSFRRGDPGESASTLQSGNKADANNGGPESHGCKRFMQTIDISRSNVMDVLYLVQPTTVCGRSVLVQICYCLMLDLVTFVDKSSLLQQEARVV